jgi:toxin ParE1/3/4
VAEYRLSPRAEDDLRNIWRYIAAENKSAGDALLTRIFEKLELAASQPKMGVARPELSPTARVIEGHYIIIYEPRTYGVLTVAIVHGMRHSDQWL